MTPPRRHNNTNVDDLLSGISRLTTEDDVFRALGESERKALLLIQSAFKYALFRMHRHPPRVSDDGFRDVATQCSIGTHRPEDIQTYLKDNYSNLRGRHLRQFCDLMFSACVRKDVQIRGFLRDITSGEAFDVASFELAVYPSVGNVYQYILKKYRGVAEDIADITVGGNGGMASIGRGEHMISIMSGPTGIKVIKNGGDLQYRNGAKEDVKWHGGKVPVDGRRGVDIHALFCKELIKEQPELSGKVDKLKDTFVPLRVNNNRTYTADELATLNALWWKVVGQGKETKLIDSELKNKILQKTFDLFFNKEGGSDSLLVCYEDGDFVRFTKAQQALEYYTKTDRFERLRGGEFLEYRPKQTNPLGLYVGTSRQK